MRINFSPKNISSMPVYQVLKTFIIKKYFLEVIFNLNINLVDLYYVIKICDISV